MKAVALCLVAALFVRGLTAAGISYPGFVDASYAWHVATQLLAGRGLEEEVVWNYVVRPLEESDLEARFGDEYVRYRMSVRCWWPRLRPSPARVSGTVHEADDVVAPVTLQQPRSMTDIEVA